VKLVYFILLQLLFHPLFVVKLFLFSIYFFLFAFFIFAGTLFSLFLKSFLSLFILSFTFILYLLLLAELLLHLCHPINIFYEELLFLVRNKSPIVLIFVFILRLVKLISIITRTLSSFIDLIKIFFD